MLPATPSRYSLFTLPMQGAACFGHRAQNSHQTRMGTVSTLKWVVGSLSWRPRFSWSFDSEASDDNGGERASECRDSASPELSPMGGICSLWAPFSASRTGSETPPDVVAGGPRRAARRARRSSPTETDSAREAPRATPPSRGAKGRSLTAKTGRGRKGWKQCEKGTVKAYKRVLKWSIWSTRAAEAAGSWRAPRKFLGVRHGDIR